MRRIALAALAALGLFAAAPAAEAQYGPYGGGYYGRQPAWVPPKVARKQAQQRERFIEKFGVPSRRYGYGPPYGRAYGYHRNRGWQDGPRRRYGGPTYGYRRDYW